jgi:hypothetical protein
MVANFLRRPAQNNYFRMPRRVAVRARSVSRCRQQIAFRIDEARANRNFVCLLRRSGCLQSLLHPKLVGDK